MAQVTAAATTTTDAAGPAREAEERFVFCETHSRRCRLAPRAGAMKCACCGKRVCLCNYVL